MSKEWKPGEIGLVPFKDDVAIGLRINGAWVTRWNLTPLDYVDVRPLAVIDPEDREAVERLLMLFKWPGEVPQYVIDDMQDALREFAAPKPPRPSEPTGLGAVVEDEDGAQYVLVTGDDEAPWARTPADAWQIQCFAWHEFSAARVLSEGVQ